jgi:hypothetical protein
MGNGVLGFQFPVPEVERGLEVEPVQADFNLEQKLRTLTNPQAAGGTLLCSYHPSLQNTLTGKLTEKMFLDVFGKARRLIAADLRR